jgi:hypothetical protein
LVVLGFSYSGGFLVVWLPEKKIWSFEKNIQFESNFKTFSLWKQPDFLKLLQNLQNPFD